MIQREKIKFRPDSELLDEVVTRTIKAGKLITLQYLKTTEQSGIDGGSWGGRPGGYTTNYTEHWMVVWEG